jgi:hypothetical protein
LRNTQEATASGPTGGVCLLHDNSWPHTAEKTTQLLEKFGSENLHHSPGLEPYDFHLFQKMEEFLSGKQMAND